MEQHLTLTAADHFALGATLYEPHAVNGRAVLINSAMGVKRGYYRKYAAFLANNGFTVLTYDYRGVGDSRPAKLRGFAAALWEWGEKDLGAALCWLSERYPSHKLLTVNHSVGGQILGLTPHNQAIAGAFCVACQSGYWQLWEGMSKFVMFGVWHVFVPTLAQAAGYFPANKIGLGEDIPAGVAREWARGGRHPRYLLDIHGGSERDFYAQFRGVILSYSFSDDNFAPRRTVEALLKLYPNARSIHRYIHPSEIGVKAIGHFGFFRSQFEESLWMQSAEWLMNA